MIASSILRFFEELGVADTVAKEGWGSVSSRNCGNLGRLAIEKAERAMMEDYNRFPLNNRIP